MRTRTNRAPRSKFHFQRRNWIGGEIIVDEEAAKTFKGAKRTNDDGVREGVEKKRRGRRRRRSCDGEIIGGREILAISPHFGELEKVAC